MKAFTYTKYGPPEALQFKDVPRPVPTDHQVLVKIHAVSLNAADIDYLKGHSSFGWVGCKSPRTPSSVGYCGTGGSSREKCQTLSGGGCRFRDTSTCGFGAFAEYVCAPEGVLTLKPANMSFEQAATLPQAGVLALQAIRDYGRIQPGNQVLINGAGGGVGTFALQIAKSFGAEVTGVDSAAKLDMLHALGAEHVLDYTQTDYTKTAQRYHLIVDVTAKRSMLAYRRALTPTVFSP